MAKKKFDTNPLDPEFPQKVREAQTQTLPNFGETDRIPPASVTEEQTRRFSGTDFSAHQNVFDGSQVSTNFHTSKLNSDVGSSSNRKVSNVGLPENILTALPYIPFFVGLIAGIIILLFVPKSETKVRFHAAQGLAAHIGILLVTWILSGVGNITDLADIGNTIFRVATMVMLIIWTIKAWQGKPVHIESVDDLTEWLEEKIKPRS